MTKAEEHYITIRDASNIHDLREATLKSFKFLCKAIRQNTSDIDLVLSRPEIKSDAPEQSLSGI